MNFQEKIIGRNQILEIVESAAEIAVDTYGLKIWGLDIVGGSGRPVVRIFVDTPWEGKKIPFVMPETRSQKSKKKSVHPKDLSLNEELFDFDEQEPKESVDETISEKILPAADDIKTTSNESVSIGQCAHISRMVALALEVEDTFADMWVLEVSSPGLERGFYQLNQLASYIGHPIEITLEDAHQDYEHRRKFRGTLESVDSVSFTLKLDSPLNDLCSISWDAVKKATLVHIFPDTTLSKSHIS